MELTSPTISSEHIRNTQLNYLHTPTRKSHSETTSGWQVRTN